MPALRIDCPCAVNLDDGRQFVLPPGRYGVVPDGEACGPHEVPQAVAAHPWVAQFGEVEPDPADESGQPGEADPAGADTGGPTRKRKAP
jgi:hypothetical protein